MFINLKLCFVTFFHIFAFSSQCAIMFHFLFLFYSLTIEEVKQKTGEAKAMLDTWQDAYLEVRAKIESSGRDARWEFDKRRLFERTGYMSSICQNLQDIAQVNLVL